MHEYDFVCSTHQWNPGELNIGFYAAMANQGTINYFQDSLDIIESNPLAHDQKIMHVVADDNAATLEKRSLEDLIIVAGVVMRMFRLLLLRRRIQFVWGDWILMSFCRPCIQCLQRGP